jgi:hypothetical protein
VKALQADFQVSGNHTLSIGIDADGTGSTRIEDTQHHEIGRRFQEDDVVFVQQGFGGQVKDLLGTEPTRQWRRR